MYIILKAIKILKETIFRMYNSNLIVVTSGNTKLGEIVQLRNISEILPEISLTFCSISIDNQTDISIYIVFINKSGIYVYCSKKRCERSF
jgi:hypothetical protein